VIRSSWPQWLGVLTVAAGLPACGSAQTEARDPLADERPIIAAADPVERKSSGVRTIPSKPVVQGPLYLPRPLLDAVLAAGPGAFLGQVPLEPVRDKAGKFAGFAVVSVYGGHPEAARFGVRPGDMLVRVAGQKLVTPGDLSSIFARLKSATELVVEVRRRGELLTLSCPIGEPPAPADIEAP
jgi:hypothetical protein